MSTATTPQGLRIDVDYSLWVAVLLPASMILFFKSGPFAWTGVIGFWIPAVVFGTWYLVMTPLLLRAIKQEADEDLKEIS